MKMSQNRNEIVTGSMISRLPPCERIERDRSAMEHEFARNFPSNSLAVSWTIDATLSSKNYVLSEGHSGFLMKPTLFLFFSISALPGYFLLSCRSWPNVPSIDSFLSLSISGHLVCRSL
jgi:hypothetical protein